MKRPKRIPATRKTLNYTEYFNELKFCSTAKGKMKNAMAIYAQMKTFVKNLQTFQETTTVQQV